VFDTTATFRNRLGFRAFVNVRSQIAHKIYQYEQETNVKLLKWQSNSMNELNETVEKHWSDWKRYLVVMDKATDLQIWVTGENSWLFIPHNRLLVFK
jgi:hypothetical protein